MRVLRPTFEYWQDAPWRDSLLRAVDEYIRRSGEEITFEETWEQVHAALFGAPGLLLLTAVDDSDSRLIGYCLLRLQPGTTRTGLLCYVWQVYVEPKQEYRLPAVFRAAWPVIEVWARGQGASRYVMITNRTGAGYMRLLRRLGFEPYAMILQRNL